MVSVTGRLRGRRPLRRSAALAAAGALALGSIGCHGLLFELGDLGADAGVDAGGFDLAAPRGLYFAPDIESDLDGLACSSGGPCHGGANTIARMKLVPNANDAASLAKNYMAVLPEAQMDADSPLLEKPLEPAGTSHVGGQQFQDTSNATYKRWLAWIRAGAPFAPDGGM